MKKTSMFILIIALVVLVPVILLLINRRRASSLNKQYTTLNQRVHGHHLLMEELSVPGTQFYNQSVDRESRHPLQETDEMGPISYHPGTRQFIIKSQEYVKLENDWRVHISYFDLNGQPLRRDSAMYNVKADLSGTIILKNYIAIYQKWKDDKREIFLRQFGIEDMWPSCLNPFTLGGINGSAPCNVWSGTGYFDLYVDGDTLRFRSPAEKKQLFFTEHNAYSTDLRYYKLPGALKHSTPTFLFYMPAQGKQRVFIIKRKDNF